MQTGALIPLRKTAGASGDSLNSAAALGLRIAQFAGAYVRSMRLYYSFITGIAGWLGVAYYEHVARTSVLHGIEVVPSATRKLAILGILFLSWGVNQIINDYLGRREDQLNAPERPMVTGELHPEWAISVSAALMLGAAWLTWVCLEPIAVTFLAAGVGLNVVYEWAKGHALLGNVVFGLMIAAAPLYGAFACGPTLASPLEPNRISVLLLVVVLNGLMTYYTYFKDYRGDLLAGKKTLVVALGMERSRELAMLSAFLPTLVFVALRITGMHQTPLNDTFLILAALTVFLQMWTGYRYWCKPSGASSYAALGTNFQACACGQAALIGIFNPDLAVWLFICSYIFVGFLFDLHRNPKA